MVKKVGLYLAPIFCDGMILQRDRENKIYGKEYNCDKVTVLFMGVEYVGAVSNHEFSVSLPAIAAGGPYEITVIASSEITISDVYFGDVYWLAGQSNMELPIKRVLDVSSEEVKSTHEPLIRQYLIPASFNFKEANEFMAQSSWQKAIEEDIYNFSALGLFFAKEIKETQNVPIGLIMTAVGGSKIESWMNPDTLKSFGDYEREIKDFKDIEYFNQYISNQQSKANEWLMEVSNKEEIDTNHYKNWDTCTLPALLSDLGIEEFQGSIYFMKEIFIDQEAKLEDALLYMGTIIDSDQIYINNVLVGRTEYRYPPRKYDIPKGVLKPGLNTIMARIVINHGNGGMIKGRPYYLEFNDTRLSLEGDWYYKIGYRATSSIPPVLFPPLLPICFYHTVVVPLSSISLKAMLWYQGESNTGYPIEYSEKFAAMVHDIRKLFGYEFPVLTVQLTNYREPLSKVEDTGWAMIREQQRRGLDLNQVGMAVTFDIGEWNDLHPQNKKEIGVRLARVARKLIYKEEIQYSGPLPKVIKEENSSLVIEFEHLDSFQERTDLAGFEVAGEDDEFYNATAYGEGNKIYVFSDMVKELKKVRYNWCDNPVHHFYNKAGLPASGFLLSI